MSAAKVGSIPRSYAESAYLNVRRLGSMDYEPVWRAMQVFTDQRDADTPDELWLV